MIKTITKKIAPSAAGLLAAVIAVGIASTATANANVLQNGTFQQKGPNGSVVCTTGVASAWSAADHWFQNVVVPHSYLCTDLEQAGFLTTIRVRTNGGAWPAAAQGNGFGQSFPAMHCAKASYWYNVTSGEITGNLVSATGPFIDFTSVLHPTGGAWKPFTSVGYNVIGLWFEVLTPVGIIPEANYRLALADVEPCLSLSPLKDVSQYLAYDPYYALKNPGGPVETIRVTNNSNVTIEGPIHVMFDGLPSGRAIVNADGVYLGSPFHDLAAGKLAPGESAELTVQFNAEPTGAIPTYRIRLTTGGL